MFIAFEIFLRIIYPSTDKSQIISKFSGNERSVILFLTLSDVLLK